MIHVWIIWMVWEKCMFFAINASSHHPTLIKLNTMEVAITKLESNWTHFLGPSSSSTNMKIKWLNLFWDKWCLIPSTENLWLLRLFWRLVLTQNLTTTLYVQIAVAYNNVQLSGKETVTLWPTVLNKFYQRGSSLSVGPGNDKMGQGRRKWKFKRGGEAAASSEVIKITATRKTVITTAIRPALQSNSVKLPPELHTNPIFILCYPTDTIPLLGCLITMCPSK